MRRSLTLSSEIARSTDERPAEVPVPYAIYEDPGGQGRRVGKYLLPEFQPARAVPEPALLLRSAQHRGKMTRSHIAGSGHVAGLEYGQVARFSGAVVHLRHERILAVYIHGCVINRIHEWFLRCLATPAGPGGRRIACRLGCRRRRAGEPGNVSDKLGVTLLPRLHLSLQRLH